MQGGAGDREISNVANVAKLAASAGWRKLLDRHGGSLFVELRRRVPKIL